MTFDGHGSHRQVEQAPEIVIFTRKRGAGRNIREIDKLDPPTTMFGKCYLSRIRRVNYNVPLFYSEGQSMASIDKIETLDVSLE